MLNTKNQPSHGDLSADEILASIRKKLGITQSYDRNINNNEEMSPHDESTDFEDISHDENTDFEDISHDENTSFDEDFTFSDDITPKNSRLESNIDKAYKTYSNAKNSAYNSTTKNVVQNKTAIANTQKSDNQDWNTDEIENFDSFLEREIQEAQRGKNAQDNTKEEEDFDIDANFDDNIQNENFIDNTATQDANDDFSFDFDTLDEQEQDILEPKEEDTLDNNRPSTAQNEDLSRSSDIGMALENLIRNQVTQWCEQNMESVCQRIINQSLKGK